MTPTRIPAPLWQKVRLLPSCSPHSENPLAGRTLWIQPHGRKHNVHGWDIYRHPVIVALAFATHLTDEDGQRLLMDQAYMEALPEFAEAIPLTPFTAWVEQEEE